MLPQVSLPQLAQSRTSPGLQPQHVAHVLLPQQASPAPQVVAAHVPLLQTPLVQVAGLLSEEHSESLQHVPHVLPPQQCCPAPVQRVAVPQVPLLQTPLRQVAGLLSDEQSLSPQQALHPVEQHFCACVQANVLAHFWSVVHVSVVHGLLSLHCAGMVHCGAGAQTPPSAVQTLPGGQSALLG